MIIDESHHFRNPLTRRYRACGAVAGGPAACCCSAPRRSSTASTTWRTSCCSACGTTRWSPTACVSLRAALASGVRLAALGPARHRGHGAGGSPARAARLACASPRPRSRSRRLGDREPIAGLRCRATRRSPRWCGACCAGPRRRARPRWRARCGATAQLLLHARDARHAGRQLTRAELRAFAGELEDQLVLWELLADGQRRTGARPRRPATDRRDVRGRAAGAAGRDDPKARAAPPAARRRPARRSSSATRRETVRYLRDRLVPAAGRVVHGRARGAGPLPAPRRAVLGWFRRRIGCPCARPRRASS